MKGGTESGGWLGVGFRRLLLGAIVGRELWAAAVLHKLNTPCPESSLGTKKKKKKERDRKSGGRGKSVDPGRRRSLKSKMSVNSAYLAGPQLHLHKTPTHSVPH